MANNFCYFVNDLMQLYDEVDMQNYLDQEEKKEELKEEEFVLTKNIDIKEFIELLKVLLANSKIAT